MQIGIRRLTGVPSPRSGSPGWVGSGWDEVRKGGEAHAIVLQLPKFYLLDTLAEAVSETTNVEPWLIL